MSVYSFEIGRRLNRKQLLDMNIISGEENELRGLKEISREQFCVILKEARVNDSFIVY